MKAPQWTYFPFAEALTDKTAFGNKIQQKYFEPLGWVPIVDQGAEFIAGYSDEASLA